MGVVAKLPRARAQRPASVVSEDGTTVRLEDEDGRPVFRLRDPSGQLVLEHRPGEGRTILHAPAGDLELCAPAGAIDLEARDGVRIRSPRAVRLQAGDDATSLELTPSALRARTPELETQAERASLTAGDVRVAARTLATAAELVRSVSGVAEVSALRVVERFREVYREVEDLQQTRAGRMRTAVAATFHLLAGRAFLKGEEDVKIRGAKIHLG